MGSGEPGVNPDKEKICHVPVFYSYDFSCKRAEGTPLDLLHPGLQNLFWGAVIGMDETLTRDAWLR